MSRLAIAFRALRALHLGDSLVQSTQNFRLRFVVVALLVGQAAHVGGVDPAVPITAPNSAPNADGRAGFVEPGPGDRSHAGWYLGVYGKYTSTGLLLAEVFPRTAAVKAGLEVGDRVVAVNGQQIGVVLKTQVDLDAALNRHANRSGWVRLLVQDRRTRQLINIDVQLGRMHT